MDALHWKEDIDIPGNEFVTFDKPSLIHVKCPPLVKEDHCGGQKMLQDIISDEDEYSEADDIDITSWNDSEELIQNKARKESIIENFGEKQVSKFHILKPKKEVAKHLNRFNLRQLSTQMQKYSNETTERRERINSKLKIIKMLENKCRQEIHPSVSIFMVGTSKSGLSYNSSYLEMSLVVDYWWESNKHNRFLFKTAKSIRKFLQQSALFADVQILHQPKPSIIFHDLGFDINCCIKINDFSLIRRTALLLAYQRYDIRVRPLVVALDTWLSTVSFAAELNEPDRNVFASFLVIHYLQYATQPTILPSLQLLFPGRFDQNHFRYSIDEIYKIAITLRKSENHFSCGNCLLLAELLRGLFSYFAFLFHFDHDIISIRLGKIISHNQKNYRYWLIKIEDPYDLSAMTTVNSSTIEEIKNSFKKAFSTLQNSTNLHEIFSKEMR